MAGGAGRIVPRSRRDSANTHPGSARRSNREQLTHSRVLAGHGSASTAVPRCLSAQRPQPATSRRLLSETQAEMRLWRRLTAAHGSLILGLQ